MERKIQFHNWLTGKVILLTIFSTIPTWCMVLRRSPFSNGTKASTQTMESCQWIDFLLANVNSSKFKQIDYMVSNTKMLCFELYSDCFQFCTFSLSWTASQNSCKPSPLIADMHTTSSLFSASSLSLWGSLTLSTCNKKSDAPECLI